ncbi:MAG: response regulator [Candidatus Hydrogenedentes bacterium]|nr:response regulator [Candidatus Hydrogenedentota bacterium]
MCGLLSGKRILLAEDSTLSQKIISKMLERHGYRVDVAANGREAVEALDSADYGAVLMDCQMPEMDGYEAVALIRQREGNTAHTPVIAMTASEEAVARERCIAAGMDDYLTKPIDSEALSETLARWIQRSAQKPGSA